MLMWFFFPVCFMPCVDYFPFVPWAIAGSGLLFTKWKFEEELTHWKRLWCCEGLGAGGKGDNRGWDGWMASLTWWTWVWVNSGNWWWTGKPGMLQSMGLQLVSHDWATELKKVKAHSNLYLLLDIKMLSILTHVINLLSPDTYLSQLWNLNKEFSMTRTAF